MSAWSQTLYPIETKRPPQPSCYQLVQRGHWGPHWSWWILWGTYWDNRRSQVGNVGTAWPRSPHRLSPSERPQLWPHWGALGFKANIEKSPDTPDTPLSSVDSSITSCGEGWKQAGSSSRWGHELQGVTLGGCLPSEKMHLLSSCVGSEKEWKERGKIWMSSRLRALAFPPWFWDFCVSCFRLLGC